MKSCKVNAVMVESMDHVKRRKGEGAYRHRKRDAYWMV